MQSGFPAALARAALLVLALAGSAFGYDQPNIVFILTDDQGVESIEGRFWSNEMQCHTPTLSRLAEQGISFTNCRVNPNCSPTRAALMTGRHGLDTGVIGVLGRFQGDNPCNNRGLQQSIAWATNRLSLQTQERTIAEVLQDSGYYTILVDKWHLGSNLLGEPLGLLPQQQGFDEFFDWAETICQDDPERIGDEHLLLTAQQAIEAVARRGNKPYALFYHTHTPHRLPADSRGMLWWQVDPALTPQTRSLPASDTNRFIQNVEALDTVLLRMLSEDGLGVIDALTQSYRPQSHTVLFFLSDNGTDAMVTSRRHDGLSAAKNTPYEGGINVPLIMFGEKISTDPSLRGTEDTSQVSAVDFFDTICDVIGASSQTRDNSLGAFPRRSMSFADRIGWVQRDSLPRRRCTLTSLALGGGSQGPVWRVALNGDRFKLICNSGGVGFDTAVDDEFYDLATDPYETVNLLNSVMSTDQVTAYEWMRERVIDEWPSAVDAWDADPPHHYTISMRSEDQRFLLVAHVVDRLLEGSLEEFYDLTGMRLTSNPNLLRGAMTREQRLAYEELEAQLQSQASSGGLAPNVQVIEWPMSSVLVMSDRRGVETGPMTIGHADVGNSNQTEYRARVIFSLPDQLSLPSGFSIDNVIGARIIVGFKADSRSWRDSGYGAKDNDTGIISIHRMLNTNTDLWNPANYGAATIGRIDLPPHIIPDPPAAVRGIPLPTGARVGSGSSEALRDVVFDWFNDPGHNYGVMIEAQRLGDLPGDQQVQMLRDVRLRIILDRTP